MGGTARHCLGHRHVPGVESADVRRFVQVDQEKLLYDRGVARGYVVAAAFTSIAVAFVNEELVIVDGEDFTYAAAAVSR